MSTSPPNLAHSLLTVCEIITFQVDKFFFSKGGNRVLKAKKTTFSSRHGLWDILSLFLGELGICLQNLIPTRGVEHWDKNYFPEKGMLKFTYKGRFLTIKKAYKKLLYWKSKWWAHASVRLLHRRFFLKQIKISNFGGISKFLKLIVFGQILTKFASFG
jgi:hypothetical protein